jgi:hypothetical protein
MRVGDRQTFPTDGVVACGDPDLNWSTYRPRADSSRLKPPTAPQTHAACPDPSSAQHDMLRDSTGTTRRPPAPGPPQGLSDAGDLPNPDTAWEDTGCHPYQVCRVCWTCRVRQNCCYRMVHRVLPLNGGRRTRRRRILCTEQIRDNVTRHSEDADPNQESPNSQTAPHHVSQERRFHNLKRFQSTVDTGLLATMPQRQRGPTTCHCPSACAEHPG